MNTRYRSSGTLWERRFKPALVDSGRYFLKYSRYIELNPVRADMVKVPGDYRWSSYRANAHGLLDSSITPHKLYMALGKTAEIRKATYRALFQSHVNSASLQLIRVSTRQNTIIGDGRFQDEIQAMLKRRVIKHRHGGDRKSKQFKLNSSTLTPCSLVPPFSIISYTVPGTPVPGTPV